MSSAFFLAQHATRISAAVVCDRPSYVQVQPLVLGHAVDVLLDVEGLPTGVAAPLLVYNVVCLQLSSGTEDEVSQRSQDSLKI